MSNPFKSLIGLIHSDKLNIAPCYFGLHWLHWFTYLLRIHSGWETWILTSYIFYIRARLHVPEERKCVLLGPDVWIRWSFPSGWVLVRPLSSSSSEKSFWTDVLFQYARTGSYVRLPKDKDTHRTKVTY